MESIYVDFLIATGQMGSTEVKNTYNRVKFISHIQCWFLLVSFFNLKSIISWLETHGIFKEKYIR